MPRTVLMGDPAYFSVLGGANPHTRTALGIRKSVDADWARREAGLGDGAAGQGAEYVAVCLPAFSLETAHRDS